MTIQQIYQLAIQLGIKADLRGKKKVAEVLKNNKEKFNKLSKEEKQFFDEERLKNPFSDTRILIDKPGKQIKKILAGIDLEVGEIVMAKTLGNIDLLLAHHPEGKALANLDDVMHLQAQVLADYGVPINIAEGVMKPRISEVSRTISPINHNENVDAARLLNFGFLCVHTPCDNLAANFLKKIVAKAKPKTVGQIIKVLRRIPEYKEAEKLGAGPKIFAGSEENSAGKIALTEITGGTEGAKEIYAKMAQAGIGTVIGMHMSEEHKKEAEKNHINVVIAGHISSDSIGMNLFLDQLERRGIKIIPCSGLIRIKRK